MDLVLEATLLVIALTGPHIDDLGLVKQFMMEAKGLLVLPVRGLWSCCGSHDRCVWPNFECWCLVEEAITSEGKGETLHHHVSPTAAFSTRRTL